MNHEFDFLEPWENAHDPSKLLKQLKSELSSGHELYGQVESVLASRTDSDDLLVRTQTGYALVHLTWCRRSEPTPPFPHTVILNEWSDFLRRFYEPEREEWNLSNPPDEWDEILAESRDPE